MVDVEDLEGRHPRESLHGPVTAPQWQYLKEDGHRLGALQQGVCYLPSSPIHVGYGLTEVSARLVWSWSSSSIIIRKDPSLAIKCHVRKQDSWLGLGRRRTHCQSLYGWKSDGIWRRAIWSCKVARILRSIVVANLTCIAHASLAAGRGRASRSVRRRQDAWVRLVEDTSV